VKVFLSGPVALHRSILAGSILALASAANAQYVSGYSVGAISQFSPTSYVSDSHSFNNTTPATYNVLTSRSAFVSDGPNKVASGSVSGSMGILKAKAFSKFPGTSSSDYSNAHSNLNALDYLTVTSGNLPLGTVVTLNFLMHLSGTFSVPTFQIGGSYQASAVATMTSNGTLGSVYKTYQNTNGLAPFDLTATMQAKVGEKINIQYSLDAMTYVSGYATVAHEASVDFSSTAKLNVWSSNPNVVLNAQSGHNYAPVPEPASFAALAIGGLGLLRRRKRA